MRILAKIVLALTVLTIVAWKGPWLYNSFLADREDSPFALYSVVDSDFIYMDYVEDEGPVRYDRKGNRFTLEQTDSLLPMFFARQLMADNRFPDSIQGIAVTPEDVRDAAFTFSAKASDANTPPVGLYPLLESMPRRLGLEMPSDVMRFTDDGVEFIVMETNRIDWPKSRRFTEAMKAKGMTFPVKRVCGNPTTEKDYDDGYFVIDNADRLYNIRMVKSRPYVRFIDLPEGVHPQMAWLTEFPERTFLGFMADTDHTLWLITREGAVAHRTGVDEFDCLADNIAIYGNLFDWTVVVSSLNDQTFFAIDAKDYSRIDYQKETSTGFAMPGLTFTSYTTPEVKLRITDGE